MFKKSFRLYRFELCLTEPSLRKYITFRYTYLYYVNGNMYISVYEVYVLMFSISNGLTYVSPLCAGSKYVSVGMYTYMVICMYVYICACLNIFVSDCCVTFLLYLAIDFLPFTKFSVLAFLFHSFLNGIKSQKNK